MQQWEQRNWVDSWSRHVLVSSVDGDNDDDDDCDESTKDLSRGSDYAIEISNNQQPEQKEVNKESSCKVGLL